jgi:hypothetical protein
MLITQAERVEYRTALKRIDALLGKMDDHLTGRIPMSSLELEVIQTTTGSSNVDGQLKALKHLRAQIDEQYDEKLRYAAQFRFSPFCEYMFRDEVPALHHEFLIEHMEAIHNGDIKRLAISMPPGAAT